MPSRYTSDAHPQQSSLSTSPTMYEQSIRSAAPPPPPSTSTSTSNTSLRQPQTRGGSASSSGSSQPNASGSERGLSPSREYRAGGDGKRSGTGDSSSSTSGGAGAGGATASSAGQYLASGRNGRQEGSDPGLAGRGAGGGGLTKGHLPPINTHLQPGGRSLSPSLASPTSATYNHDSSSYHHSHRSSLLAHPRPLQPNSLATAGSSSSSHRQQTPSPTFPPNSSSTSASSHRSYHQQPPSRPTSAASHHRNFAGGSSSSQHHLVGSGGGGGEASHSENGERVDRGRRRGDSGASGDGGSSSQNHGSAGGSGSGGGKRSGTPTTCAKCELPMTGQFVRALGTVYHLDCFRCQDCNKVVAAKFFPIDSPDSPGKQVPLCETDYFRRLNLLCSKCGAALRGSYITALDMKFHVEHFTCSVCPTVFGPQDSYYEHSGSVYCHFHYSTRFAVKCTGCRTAILKQFVEINRNSIDEHWHPECYMIHKFWNIKLAPTPKPNQETLPAPPPPPPVDSSNPSENAVSPTVAAAPPPASPPQPDYVSQEETETPSTLKSRQKHMEEQVYRIWTILSAFEESSAACISEMLRHVSSGHYVEGVRMAEKFVLHVETLFAAIDDLNAAFRSAASKEMSHVREARMLCKKVVNFFMLLSHTHETGARKMSITQELLSLVTGLAHYLKILIRIALTGSLKLEREFSNTTAIGVFLGRLDRLARDPDANRMTNTSPTTVTNGGSSRSSSRGDPPTSRRNAAGMNGGGSVDSAMTVSASHGGKARPYGYKSLTRAVGTLVGQGEATTDLCEECRLTVEEECARLGTSIRWHLPCLKCRHCSRIAAKDQIVPGSPRSQEEVYVKNFVWVDNGHEEGGSTYCKECAKQERGGSLEDVADGFEYVTRLEQYAFLLCVALNKLYGRLKQRGVVPAYDHEPEGERSLYDTYRDSTDIKRMKSVQLDRKLSSTTARIPQRSTVVQSPSGRTAQSDDSSFSLFQAKPPVPSRKDQPIVDPIRGTVIPRQNLPSVPSGVSTPASTSSSSTPRLQQIEQSPVEERIRPSPATATSASTSVNTTSPPLAPTHHITSPPPHHAQLPPAQQPPQRPGFQRATTAVRIVDEQPDITPQQEGPVLGGIAEPTQDENGITLADLPKVMEAEQKRAEQNQADQRHYFPNKLLSELTALEYFIVKHVAAVLLASETSALRDVAPLDDLLEIIDARKNTFWGKLFKGGNEQKKVKKKGVFGIPLEVLVERNGADSMHGAGPGSLRIPSFVDDVISAMKQMDMSIEGIFRKNGNIRRLKDLSEALDRDSTSANLSDDNPVQLAALLKKFLRDLPDPLMTFKLFHLFIAAQRIEDTTQRKKILHLCCCLMPKPHRDTMEVLFVFLKWVASFSHVDEETGSKMDLQNLATVISPNILYAKGKDPARDESFSAARAVHELLELQDDFWEVPSECLSILNDQELFANPSQLTSKEILARTENHLNGRGGGGWRGGVSISRGEASPAQRPGLQEAWSAPIVPGARPMSTSAQPSHRPYQERPISFSAQNFPYPGANGGGGLSSPTTRSFPNTPFSPPGERRGVSEGVPAPSPRGEYSHQQHLPPSTSSSSSQRQPYPQQQHQQQQQQGVPVRQR